jgi:anaerobic selenocysteine-containing dehydrogenase
MCACRCGINVHLRDGKIRYIEGNRDHPVNKGVLCAKGSAGIMQHYSPARLRAPLRRVGPRGSGQFEEISWEEALQTATDWLAPIRKSNPRKLAFFTGRDQSQALTGWWAQQFGTPNFAAHGGFCSVNMAAGGIYTLGGAFWEFGSPDWDLTELFILFGVAEDHDSNPIKIGLGKLKTRGARVISVNPVQTGYAAISDDWYGVTPGTDGLLILSLVRELMRAGKVDIDYLSRYTNAPWLVIRNPGKANDGLFLRDDDGTPLVLDRTTGKTAPHSDASVKVALKGEVKVKGGGIAVPAFTLMAEAYLIDDYAPETVAPMVGITAERIRQLAADLAKAAFEKEVVIEQPWTDWKGEKHDRMVGRPVSMHAMRGISAHSNGFQTCRALHMLQLLLGSVEAPGGFRFKPPYPKPPHVHPKPAGRPDQVAPETPLAGAPLGYVLGPEDLIIGDDGSPQRIDKAYSWDAPMSAHGMMHMVISNAVAGDPYPVDVLFMYMANMAWNSSMNTRGVMEMLTETDPETGEYKIPKLIYSDAYSSEMVAYADLVLPDTTYLERHDAISLLDRPICEADAVADAIRWPVSSLTAMCAASSQCCLILARGLAFPAWSMLMANRNMRIMATISSITSASPGSGRWPGSAAPMATPRGAVSRTANSLTPILPMVPSGTLKSRPRHAISSRRMRPISNSPSRWDSMTRRNPMPSRSMSRCCRNSVLPPRGMATSNHRSIFASASGPASPRCQAGTRPSREAPSMTLPIRCMR